PEDVPHIFEPYFTRKEPGLGTGLGLAISMSTLNDFGGRIEYAPAEGGGAVFVFYLPAAV
ncbi:MAG: sensor histidine kinase, partial [Candidatus Adiutrix sp.]|nr:sensor histidine kinase [Candidatus Adiutrix sp.]